MVDSLRELTGGSGSTDSESDATELLAPILQDGETVRFVVESSSGVEQTVDGETTTLKPDSGHNAYAVVTDFRVLFLVGTDDDEVEIDIEFDLASVTMSKVRSGLLSSSLVVTANQTRTAKFKPLDGSYLAEVADYIDRLSDCWADFERALASTREAIDAFEAALKAGEDPQEELTTAQSRLSNAHHHATREEDGPVEAMLARLEPVEDELDQLQVGARLDRVDDLLAEAESQDSFDDAVASLVEARDRLVEARDALDDEILDTDAVSETIAERAAAVDEYAQSLLADAEDACHRALDAEDDATAAEAWGIALDRYRAMLAADWAGLGGVDDVALRFQLAWVVGNRIDVLCARSAALEAEADEIDDGDDGATELYEQARAHAESARDLAEEHSWTDAARFADRLDELEEKIEVSEWQWGDA